MYIIKYHAFNQHAADLVKQLKIKLGFYFRNKACFSLQARKELSKSALRSTFYN